MLRQKTESSPTSQRTCTRVQCEPVERRTPSQTAGTAVARRAQWPMRPGGSHERGASVFRFVHILTYRKKCVKRRTKHRPHYLTWSVSGQRKRRAAVLSDRHRGARLYILMISYSRVPRPIFSACSRQLRHSELGVELVNGSPQSAKPGLRRLSQSWLPGSACWSRHASTHA